MFFGDFIRENTYGIDTEGLRGGYNRSVEKSLFTVWTVHHMSARNGAVFLFYVTERSGYPHDVIITDGCGANNRSLNMSRIGTDFRHDATERNGADNRMWENSRIFTERMSDR